MGATKGHGYEGSHENLKKLPRNSSTTSLKKNASHTTLKRNRSAADVEKRPKSSEGGGGKKRPASVHFEIGDNDDGWEEASSSASPVLSRTASRSGQSSFKPSANNSEHPSPLSSSKIQSQTQLQPTNGNGVTPSYSRTHTAADAKQITERLLQRTPSQHTTTKMSLATATPTGHGSPGPPSPDSLGKSQLSHTSTLHNGTPKIGSGSNKDNEPLSSRFVSGSGTPGENSPFLHMRKPKDALPLNGLEEVKRAKSMSNLTSQNKNNNHDDDDATYDYEEEASSALAPRSRKSSTGGGTSAPINGSSNQSRTQQKLWLQRASSNIEPGSGAALSILNGSTSMSGIGISSSLVGAGYDGRDPRIKMQLERTGMEYLVVRRFQDPVGKALRRLEKLPGNEGVKRIPRRENGFGHVHGKSSLGAGGSGLGLSSSLRERPNGSKRNSGVNGGGVGGRSSYEGPKGQTGSAGGQEEERMSGGVGRGADGDDGVQAILRSLWDKSFDLSASAD